MKSAFIVLGCILLFSCSPSILVADKKPKGITIATWNVEWFYDSNDADNTSDLAKKLSAPSRDAWDWKLNNVARVIGEMKPTILALQEIENRQVVQQLTKLLDSKYRLKYRIAFIEGWDRFTEQDVAIIYRSGLVQYSRREQSSEMFKSKDFYNVNKHLFAKFEWGEGDDKESLTVLTFHLRAQAEKHGLREKQCRLIRHWVRPLIENGENVVILGDVNTEELAESIGNGTDMGILCGWETETQSDDLFDLHQKLAPEFRGTHLGGRQFDRILVSKSMIENGKRGKDLTFSQIANFRKLVIVGGKDTDHFDSYYDIPANQRDVSDHYPVMAEFLFK